MPAAWPARMEVSIDAFNGLDMPDAYVSMGIGGGFALHEFVAPDGAHRVGNRAFFNVLANVMRQRASALPRQIEAGAVCACVSVRTAPAKVPEAIAALLGEAAHLAVGPEEFERARVATERQFTREYKDELFRAEHRSLEFIHRAKHFSLDGLARDVRSITYEMFSEQLELVLAPGNICFHVLGAVDAAACRSVGDAADDAFMARPQAMWIAPGADPYLHRDSHFVMRGRTDACVSAVALLTDARPVLAAERRVLLDLMVAASDMPPCEVVADAHDAGIIVVQERPVPLRDRLTYPAPEHFDQALQAVFGRYVALARANPRAYGATAVEMMLSGTSLNHYLESVLVGTYEGFDELRRRVDPFFREAQVLVEGMRLHG